VDDAHHLRDWWLRLLMKGGAGRGWDGRQSAQHRFEWSIAWDCLAAALPCCGVGRSWEAP
jgi:hypothetical protein